MHTLVKTTLERYATGDILNGDKTYWGSVLYLIPYYTQKQSVTLSDIDLSNLSRSNNRLTLPDRADIENRSTLSVLADLPAPAQAPPPGLRALPPSDTPGGLTPYYTQPGGKRKDVTRRKRATKMIAIRG